MTIRLRTAFLLVLGLFVLWFLFLERAILTPFIVAAIFAYIFNPIVDFFSHKVKLPRTLSILIIYFVIIFLVVFCAIVFTRRVIAESSDLRQYSDSLLYATKHQVSLFPDWVKPGVNDAILSLNKIRIFNSSSIFEIFPKAVSRIISFFIFLVSAFYFLKEGRNFINRLLLYVPKEQRIDVEIMLKKINQILNGYLRGQIFMVFLVSLVLFLILSFIGVRFALILAVFSGIAEIVPIIGPIVAAAVAASVVAITGISNFSLTPLQSVILIIVVYFIVRQIQDYFVTPVVMGRITKLHPLIILFAVLTGQHSFGILGLILAVPVAAVVKLILDYSFDKISDKELEKKSLGR